MYIVHFLQLEKQRKTNLRVPIDILIAASQGERDCNIKTEKENIGRIAKLLLSKTELKKMYIGR